jgi:hypothetical protein
MYGKVRKAVCSLRNPYLSTDIQLVLTHFGNYEFKLKYKDAEIYLTVNPSEDDATIKKNLIRLISTHLYARERGRGLALKQPSAEGA